MRVRVRVRVRVYMCACVFFCVLIDPHLMRYGHNMIFFNSRGTASSAVLVSDFSFSDSLYILCLEDSILDIQYASHLTLPSLHLNQVIKHIP